MPAKTLTDALLENGTAVTDFDAKGYGLVRLNLDGQVDFFDYLDFSAAFAAEDASADFDGDGQVDFFDYLDFVSAFSAGC